MASRIEMSEQVERFLLDKLSLDEFEDWSAESSWNIHREGDEEAQNLAYLVESLLVEHGNGDLSDLELREELANAVRPFAQSRVYGKSVELVYGRPRFKTTSTTESVPWPVAV